MPAIPSRDGSSGPRQRRSASTSGCCATSKSLSCRLRSAARSSAPRAEPHGCVRPSRCVPDCGPGACSAAAPLETPRPSSTTSSFRGRVVGFPLIATEGFEYDVGVIERLFGSACVSGHVLKTRRNDRVVRVERRRRIGTAGRLKAALWESEDAETLHTSFVERLNRTIRQGLGVRAPSLALPRPWRRPAPRARRPLALLLQCHPAAQGVEGRSRNPDASAASRLGERANELERHLHGAGRALRIPCGGRTRSRCRPAHAHEPSRAVIVLVAARTQIGCLINSEWRKHPWLRTFSRGCEGLLDHRNNLNGAVHHGQMRARLRESLERLHALAFQQTVAVHETGVIPDALFLDLPGFANQLRGRGTLARDRPPSGRRP